MSYKHTGCLILVTLLVCLTIDFHTYFSYFFMVILRDVRILRQKLKILRAIFANSAQHFNPFFYGTIVCDTGVLSRVSWFVGLLKLRVTIQLTLSLSLLFTFVKEN